MASARSYRIETEGDELRLVCDGTPVTLRYSDGRWGVVDQSTLQAEMTVLGGLGDSTDGLDRALGVCAALNDCAIYPDEAASLNKQLHALEAHKPSRFWRIDADRRVALTSACAHMRTEGAWRWLLWMLPKRLEPSLDGWGIVPGPFGWDRPWQRWEHNGNFALWLGDEFWEAMTHHSDPRFAQLVTATDPDADPEALRELAVSHYWEICELVTLNPKTPEDALPGVHSTAEFPARERGWIQLRLMQRRHLSAGFFAEASERYLAEFDIQSGGSSGWWWAPAFALWAVCHPRTPSRILTELGRNLTSEFDHSERVLAAVAGHPKASRTLRERLACDGSHKVRAGAASNPKAHAPLLTRLGDDRRREVRAAVAGNRNTPPGVLELLADDRTALVRRGVADNRSTPAQVLERLTLDPDFWTARYAAVNPSLSAEAAEAVQKRLLAEGNVDELMVFCCRSDTSAEALDGMAEALGNLGEEASLYDWGCLAGHPNSSADVLEEMFERAVSLEAADEYAAEYLLSELLDNPNLPDSLRRRAADALPSRRRRPPRLQTLEARKQQQERKLAADRRLCGMR